MSVRRKQSVLAGPALEELLARKVTEVARQPGYSGRDGVRSFMTEQDG